MKGRSGISLYGGGFFDIARLTPHLDRRSIEGWIHDVKCIGAATNGVRLPQEVSRGKEPQTDRESNGEFVTLGTEKAKEMGRHANMSRKGRLDRTAASPRHECHPN